MKYIYLAKSPKKYLTLNISCRYNNRELHDNVKKSKIRTYVGYNDTPLPSIS
jgi:hypothetical protein